MAEACTCTIRNHGRVIEFCPLHKAAEQMQKALEWALTWMSEVPLPTSDQALRDRFAAEWVQASTALAAARGQEVGA